MKNYDDVQKYLSNVSVLITKLHNLHWNVEGKRFMQIHNFTEELYDYFFEVYDEVAELMKMKGEMPLSTMADYLEHATVEEVEAKAFTPNEVLETVQADLEEMKEMASAVRDQADEEGDFEFVGEFEEHVGYYSKNLWFIRAILAE